MTPRRRCVLAAALAVVLAGAAHAQRSYQDVTPGVSTRGQVDAALGAPSRVVSATLSEYRGVTGITRVEVEFDGAGDQARTRRIDAVLAPPITRRALTSSYGLAEPALRAARDNRLVEYFGAGAWLAFVYAGADESTGVERVSHLSEAAFYEVSGLPKPTTTPPATGPAPAPPTPAPAAAPPAPRSNKTQAILGGIIGALAIIDAARRKDATRWNDNTQASLEGVYLTTYAAGSADRCRADCAQNASCRAFTFVRAGHPNPGDPSMCYLMSSVIRFVPAPCCSSGVKVQAP